MLLRVSRRACFTVSRGRQRSYSLLGAPIDISPEVQDALQRGSPVVALESTIITHGMPHPINLETALSVEAKVRATGSIPATIAVLEGRIIVGLQKPQFEILADNNGKDLIKLSRRDLAAAVGLGRSGGTTISATSLIASRIGIPVFATGGLGGVHRGGEISWDVSADLTELGRTPIAVVSAGVKSILDIGRTLEYLETQGVAVVTYGTSEFPGFFSRQTGYKSPWRVDSPEAAAQIMSAAHRFGLNSGILFAAPIPEEHAGAAEIIQKAVDRAVKESKENGIDKRGKEATPWLLRRVAELTQGRSIPSNIALIENTAQIGGNIAVEYAKLRGDSKASNVLPILDQVSLTKALHHESVVPEPSSPSTSPPATVLVVGAAAIDVVSQPAKSSSAQASLATHSTSPGQVIFTPGGVARNIAEAAHRILSTSDESELHQVLLVSPIGTDLAANLISDGTRRLGMRSDGLLTIPGPNQRSAVCSMHLDTSGNLTTGVADMTIVETMSATPIIEVISKHHPKIVALDANLSPETLTSLVRFCFQRQIGTFFEPTSVIKSASIVSALSEMVNERHFHSAPITFASPNRLELSHLFQQTRSSPYELTNTPHWWSVIDGLSLGEQYRSDLALLSRQLSTSLSAQTLDLFSTDGIPQMAISLLPFFQHLFIKCGENGVFVAMRIVGEAAITSSWYLERTRPEQRQLVVKGKDSILVMKHYPALSIQREDIVNVTGAGDSFVGALLAALGQADALSTPQGMDDTVGRAQLASLLSLRSSDAVSPLLCSAITKP